MNLDNLTNKQKDNLINRMALHNARCGSDCSALMYCENGKAIKRILDLFEDYVDKEIKLDSFEY